jgi:hypothetical protein
VPHGHCLRRTPIVSGSQIIQRRDRRLASCHNGTFPSSLPRTDRASFPAISSPVWTLRPFGPVPHLADLQLGLWSFPCYPSPCGQVSLSALVGRHSHDYYGNSVALGLAACRRSRHAMMLDVLAHCRCPVPTLMPPHWRWPVLRRVPGQPSNSRHRTATGFRRFTVGTARVRLGRGVRAIQLSSWCAGLAEPPILQRLRTISAFSTGYVSPFPFGSRLVPRPSNIPPSFSTLRVGSIISTDGAIGSRKDWSHHVRLLDVKVPTINVP